MADSQEKGKFRANIPEDAVAAALRSVERAAKATSPGTAGEPPDADPIDVEAPYGDAVSPEMASLQAQLELSQALGRETQKKLEDAHDRWLRAAADLENYKKRAQREREDVQKFGVEKLVKDLLPVIDNLDRALAAAAADDPLVTGVKLVRSTFEQVLTRHGVGAFSAMGQIFDPSRHEALMQVPTSDVVPGTVVLEHARGFTLHDRLIRPAMVGVAVALRPDPDDQGSGGAS
jgi:molecular chaperone GrpE